MTNARAAALSLLAACVLAALGGDARAWKGKGRGKAKAGLFFGAPAAPVPDIVIPVIASMSQSWGDPLSTFGGPAFLTAETCPAPVVSGTCAIWTRPSSAAGPAVELGSDNASTFVVPAVHALSRALQAAGGTGRVGIVHTAFPGVRTSQHTTTQLLADLDALAALAAAQGFVIYVPIFADNGGGFQHQELGDPFSVWSNAIETQRSAIAAHVAGRVAALTPGYCTTCPAGPADVAYNDGSLHAAGGLDDVREVHPYSAAFDAYEDASHSSCFNAAFVDLQPGEGIHPTLAGSTELADQTARCWLRILQSGFATSLRATAAVALPTTTQIRVTYDVPCRAHGGCVTDPPLALNVTDQPARTSVGDVVTWGVHAQLNGSLVTLPAASTFVPDSCAWPATSCTAVITFAAPLPAFDLLTFCDTAEGPTGEGAGAGGCNVFSATSETWGADPTAAGDWQQNSQIAATSYDGGTDAGVVDASDGGTADAGDAGPDAGDAGPDAGPDGGIDGGADGGAGDAGTAPDAALFVSAESVEFNASGGSLSLPVSSGPFDDLDGHTVLVWTNNPGLYQAVVRRWGGTGPTVEQWWLGVVEGNAANGSQHWALGLEAGGTAGVDCSGNAAVGGWLQVGGVYDGAGTTAHCVINGAFADAQINGPIPASLNDEDQPITIGSSGDSADVDTFSYFSCALSEPEALRVYCSTHGASGHTNSAACATAGPSGESVGAADFGAYVIGHPCFLDHCEFEDTASGGNGFVCWASTYTEVGLPTYTTAQP